MGRGPVLIIDDDPGVLRSVGKALANEGYDILTAQNGQAGLDVASQQSLSLILLDIGMPVMDGIEFLDRYRDIQDHAAPVVVLTGLAERARWNGIAAVLGSLAKPFDLDELIELVGQHLGERLHHDDLQEPRSDQDALAAELLAKVAADRDPESLGRLYELFSPAGFGICLHTLPDRMWAEDTLQEAFLNVWHKAGSFDASKGSAKRWVLSVIYHQAIDRVRKRRRDASVPPPWWMPQPDSTAPDAWSQVELRLQRELIVTALQALPAEQRQVVQLAYFGGYTHSEMAALLRVPLGTVKGRLRLAMDKLRLSLPARGVTPSLN